MPQIGKIGTYDDSVESWESYEERLQAFMTANDIDDEHKVPALISVIGPKTYTLLKNLVAPEKATDKTFDALLKALHDNLSPKPSIIAERFRFHKRNQRPDESIFAYVAELRKLATHCQFEATLSDTLRDRLVCGLRQETIQKRLLSERDLDLEKAIQLSVAMETAAKDAAEVQGVRGEQSVNRIKTQQNKPRAFGKKKGKPPTPQPQRKPTCLRCNGEHLASNCNHSTSTCAYCRKEGHIERACMKKKRDGKHGKQGKLYVNFNTQEDEPSDYYEPVYEPFKHITSTFHVKTAHVPPIFVHPMIDGKVIKMEIDTGTAVSIISKHDYSTYLSSVPLNNSHEILRTYSGDTISPIGKIRVNVKINHQSADLDLLVVPQDGPPLLGRDWLSRLRLDWLNIKSVNSLATTKKTALDDVLADQKELFSEGIGKMKHIKGSISVKPDAPTVFLKARTVPYSLRSKVEEELDKLQSEGIIESVPHSQWATPIVPALKKNGNVRVCGDYRVTVNPVIRLEQYPLPKIEDIFASLAGGKKFTKLDLTQAYHHMELDDESQQLLVINTHKGLFKYKRLPYGIASAPALWQGAIDQVLQNIPFTQVILDDIIISGRTEEEHLHNLKLVLDRLQEYGLRVNLQKCEFFQEKVSYCGHEIDEKGLHKSPEKIKALKEAQRPENVSQLRSFLGLVDAYSKWPEAFEMRTTTTAATINVLRTLFARQGIPNELVSDNGPQFRSEEFRLFMESNAIRHITSAPFHPRTNGQAERFVQSFKKAIKSATGGSINEKLNVFLSKYRITPQGTTNESPSMLLYGRNIRTRMDILKPDVTQTVLRKQFQMESSKHTGDKIRTFAPGDPVSIRDYRNNGEKCAYGHVHSQTGPLSYKVDVNGTLWRRHIDQLASATNSQVKGHLSDTCDSVEIPPLNPPISQSIAVPDNPTKIINPKLSQGRESQSEISVPRRNPINIRKAPDRLNLWIGAQ
ncbi:hypothetical protein FSP39_015888 [Pinctada imbricata]|uniref:Reverse transcriptase n=1 Tax=Pinctada imbricata TaxID=66713 RepID=A0AA88YW94_PINIB|nr:hypothetical protein FSP39_015888 [Pinctada imbricata]